MPFAPATSFPNRRRLKTAAAGPLIMLASGLLFGAMDCLIKLLGPSFRAWDIAFYRFGCGMAILVLLFARNRDTFIGNNRKLLTVRGVTGCISFLAFVLALQLIPISTALVLFYSYPAFAALFSALFFQEKMTAVEILWVLVAICGVGVFIDTRLEGGIFGQVVTLVGAAFSGVALSIVKKARETNGPVVIYFYFCLTGAAMTFIPFVSDPHLPASSNEWLILGGIVTTSLAAQLLMNQGFHYCRSFEGGLFLTSELLFVALWGFVFLHDPITWHSITGGTMILGSMIGLSQNTGPAEK
jgi:drug/metabolite transporter (DMT)-like permease